MTKTQSNQSNLPLFSSDQVVPDADRKSVGQATLSATASEKPKKSITVVCACIMRQGGQEVLLSVRNAPGVQGLHGKWELPGGKVEFGETPEHAIIREIREELGIRISPKRLLPYLHTNLWEYEHAIQHVVLACYESEPEQDVFGTVAEHAKWFHINEIDFGSTLPGTREFISLATEDKWFDKVYIEFETSDSAERSSRRFTVATQPTLYSRYGLVKYWGRLGMAPRTKFEEFASPTELDEHIFETVKRRLASGYHIRTLKGPDESTEVLARIREFVKQINEYSGSSITLKQEPSTS